MTEASPVVTYNKPEWAIPGSIGRVIPAMRYKLADLDGNEGKQLFIKRFACMNLLGSDGERLAGH